jgi:hypothetical protein
VTDRELRDVLARHPWLADGLPDHADVVVRCAVRLLALEASLSPVPTLPASAPEFERAFWSTRASRRMAVRCRSTP